MRVLLASGHAYPGGGDCIQMLDSARRLRDAGHDVGVFALAHEESEFTEWSRFWPRDVDFASRPGGASGLAMGMRSVYAPSVGRHLRRMLEAFRPDVAHLHSVHHYLTMAVPRELIRTGIPIVWTLHDYRTVCPSTHLLLDAEPCERCAQSRFYRALPVACKSGSTARTVAAVTETYLTRLLDVYAHVDRFIAPSRFLASTLARMGFRGSQTDVIPNPIAPGTDRTAARDSRADVLFVGRMSAEKGPDLLLRACRALKGVRVVFVGDGPMKQELVSYARAHAIDVSFAGWQSPALVRDWMRGSRVLCVPSTCYENCPGVVLEGMAEGIPVLASDRGGIPELLDHGRCGFLAESGSEDAWRTAIRNVLSDRDDATQRAAVARRRLRVRHDPDTHTDALVQSYRFAIAARRECRVRAARHGV
jgi:glycosyltransferase involved in cell wall biosynthesis